MPPSKTKAELQRLARFWNDYKPPDPDLSERRAIDETYRESANLLYYICHRWANLYGFPFEDLLGEAHTAFIQAYYRFNPGKGARFGTYLYFSVTNHLKDYRRWEDRHRLHEPLGAGPEFGVQPPDSFLHDLRDLLSEDARSVVDLIVSSPPDLVFLIRGHRKQAGLTYLQILRRYLREELDWERERAETAFDEIRQIIGT